MLETIIKNTILVSLIILILHFLIKNKLLENSIKQTRARHVLFGGAPAASVSPLLGGAHNQAYVHTKVHHSSPVGAGAGSKKDDDADIEAYFKAHVRQMPIAASPKPNPLFNSDEDAVLSKSRQANDLYNYVYADDASNSLNAYFDESSSKKTQVKCDPFSTDKRMCKNPIEMHIESQAKKPLAKKPSDLKLFKNSVEVREYENENVMNGAPLVGNLSGFDTYEVQFQ